MNKNFETISKVINHAHPESIQEINVSEEMEDGIKAFEDENYIYPKKNPQNEYIALIQASLIMS